MPENGVVLKQGKVIAMSAGIAVLNKPISYEITCTDKMPLAKNTELEYVKSDGSKITVKIGDRTGTLSIVDIILIPALSELDRSYYEVVNSKLVFKIYSHTNGSFEGENVIGVAPDFMKADTKYFSTDGITFTTRDGKKVGKAYNYYQFLPLRTKTAYTAKEIDAYIARELKDREAKGSSGDTETYGYGAVLGSKEVGMNVKYAADTNWGAKAAAHYYAFEKESGFKDAKQNYKIGFTNDSDYLYLRVRIGPSTSFDELYNYKRFNLPVLVYGEENGWYKITSDKLHDKAVYIRGDYITLQETTK
ncbi:hypothetical protein ACIQ2D_03720 [Lysinibacillus sp. NPDC097287]|uniref:hypothetical protein n=1 Tax=Lysinibacillus sp. NPDC097287 TaxID=3364144 RepID=UPI003813E68E